MMKHLVKHFLCPLFICAVLIFGMPLSGSSYQFETIIESVPAVLQNTNVNLSQYVRRCPEEETMRSIVYERTDGNYEAFIFCSPVKYIDDSGKIKDMSKNMLSSASFAISCAPDAKTSPSNLLVSVSKPSTFSGSNSCLQKLHLSFPVFTFNEISVAPHLGHLV